MTFPLTDFLIAMLKARDEGRNLANADPVRLSRKYGLSEDHVRGYLAMMG